MVDIRSSFDAIRNKIVVNNSKILKNEVTDNVLIDGLKTTAREAGTGCLYPRVKPQCGDFRCRQVKNGKDTYYVAEQHMVATWEKSVGDQRDHTPSDVETKVRSFVVKHGDDEMSFVIHDNKITWEEEKGRTDLAPKLVRFGGKEYKLDSDTNILDINQVRYQLRNYKEISYFLDKFVIVSEEERKAYRKYEAERLREERVKKLKAHIEDRVKKVEEVVKTVREARKVRKEEVKAAKRREYFIGRRRTVRK